MTERPWLCVCRWLAAASVAAYCLWQGVSAALPYFGSSDALSYLSDWRSAARSAPEGRLALLCSDARGITPIERSRLVAMTWERAPAPIATVAAKGDLKEVDGVLASRWIPRPAQEWLGEAGFSDSATNEFVCTWSGAGAVGRDAEVGAPRVSRAREILALAVELALMLFAVVLVSPLRNIGKLQIAAATLVAVAMGAVALSHPLLAPNGLGVYGGKAKLLYECGGSPESFLNSAGGMALQPSYPPGLTLLAYLHFLLSGGCGDRLVQLVVVFAMTALCLTLLRGASRPSRALPIVLFCVSPLAIRMTSGFYAEPFVALLLVLGWQTMGSGRLFVGALIMGMAGLFRLEAGAAAVIFAACGCVVRGNFRTKLIVVVSAVVPTLISIATCRLLGYGGLTDWNVTMMPRFEQVVYAALVVLNSLWKQSIPVFVLLFLVRPDERRVCSREVLLCILPVALLGCAIPLVCGFYDAPYAKWMMDNTMPRLIWYLLPVPMFVMVSQISSHDFGIIRSRKKDKSDV